MEEGVADVTAGLSAGGVGASVVVSGTEWIGSVFIIEDDDYEVTAFIVIRITRTIEVDNSTDIGECLSAGVEGVLSDYF